LAGEPNWQAEGRITPSSSFDFTENPEEAEQKLKAEHEYS
jgi:hypothetical protein